MCRLFKEKTIMTSQEVATAFIDDGEVAQKYFPLTKSVIDILVKRYGTFIWECSETGNWSIWVEADMHWLLSVAVPDDGPIYVNHDLVHNKGDDPTGLSLLLNMPRRFQ